MVVTGNVRLLDVPLAHTELGDLDVLAPVDHEEVRLRIALLARPEATPQHLGDGGEVVGPDDFAHARKPIAVHVGM